MSSSRSDVVTQFVRSFVRPFVRPLFFLLASLEFYLVLNSFNGVSRKFSVCLKFLGVLRKLQGCFKEVLRVFTKSFKEVKMVFQGSFEGVSKKF